MFRRVVLPAPFGPITDTIDPRSTLRSTRWTACTPPNDFDTARTFSCMSGPVTARSTPLAQPALASPIVLDVPVALPSADARESQVKLLHILVLADSLRIAVQDDP